MTNNSYDELCKQINNEFKKNNGLKVDLKINLDLKIFFKRINPYLKKKEKLQKISFNYIIKF